MTWFQVAGCDNTAANPLVTDSHDLRGYDEYAFMRGSQFTNWDPTSWLKASRPENDGDPDDALQNHLGLPVYSARLSNALTASGIHEIQYLPVQILRPSGECVLGFSIANTLSVVSALDIAHSDYDTFPDDYFLPERRGRIAGLRRAILRASALHGHDVVRLAEFPFDIFVAEAFRSTFDSAECTGYSFVEVEITGQRALLV